MLHRVRIALPDRPGSLAKVARVMAASGADVVRVDVLEREAGRAVDDFLLDLPIGRGARDGWAGAHAEPGSTCGAGRAEAPPTAATPRSTCSSTRSPGRTGP